MERKKIMVSAYACEPGYGTEIGVGWHWTLEMSKYFEVWVLTRESNKENIEEWISKNNQRLDIHFVYYDLPKKLRFWKKGLRGVRTYYCLWQRLTNKIIKKTMEENDIHIYHLLTYGNSLWPASKYGMKQTFIWGPTGGVDTIPKEYSKRYPAKARFVEFVRRTIVRCLKINIGFKKRCKNADLILCKSYGMLNNVPKKFKDKAKLFTDVAVEMKNVTGIPDNKYTKYLAVGRLDAWRGFDVLIEAFAKAVKTNEDIRLDIVGDGKDRKRLEDLIDENGMEGHIRMCGELPMKEYEEKVAKSDVIVNPSLKEGAVTVAFDSLAMDKPLICIDTGGYTRYFDEDRARVIKLARKNTTVNRLSEAILELIDKSLRDEMINKIKEDKVKYTWYKKGLEIRDVINECLEEK